MCILAEAVDDTQKHSQMASSFTVPFDKNLKAWGIMILNGVKIMWSEWYRLKMKMKWKQLFSDPGWCMHGTLRTLGITFQQPSKGSLPQQGFGERGWRQPDFMLCGERRVWRENVESRGRVWGSRPEWIGWKSILLFRIWRRGNYLVSDPCVEIKKPNQDPCLKGELFNCLY